MHDNPPTRERNRDAAARIEARALVRPYLSLFPLWQQRSALITARLLARSTIAREKAPLLGQLDELIAEVDRSHAAFAAATLGAPGSSQVRDVDQAFRRLRWTLGNISSAR